jgi:hypothetical protein
MIPYTENDVVMIVRTVSDVLNMWLGRNKEWIGMFGRETLWKTIRKTEFHIENGVTEESSDDGWDGRNWLRVVSSWPQICSHIGRIIRQFVRNRGNVASAHVTACKLPFRKYRNGHKYEHASKLGGRLSSSLLDQNYLCEVATDDAADRFVSVFAVVDTGRTSVAAASGWSRYSSLKLFALLLV